MYNYSLPTVVAPKADVEDVKPKTIQEQIIEEAQDLEKPTESVAFLNYMMKHTEKVDSLQKRLTSFSKALLGAGLLVAGYAAFMYMTTETAVVATQQPHKLGASRESSVSADASMFNGISVLIWSMVAAKAKTGLAAATKGETKSVGDALKQAGALILMIAVASGLNIYMQMDDLNAQATPKVQLEQAATATFGKMLQSSHKVSEVASSHFKGGVASAAFDEFSQLSTDDFSKTAKKAAKTSKIVNKSIKGFKTPAKPAKKQAGINVVIDALEAKKAAPTAAARKMLRSANSNQQYKEVTAYLLFVLTTGISIAYYVTFKTYHTSLAKLDSLKKMLNNPKARVASGRKGRSILQRIKADEKKEHPKKIVESKAANETVSLLKELIEARKVQKKSETEKIEKKSVTKKAKSAYTAPLLDVNQAPKVQDNTMAQIKQALAERQAANQLPLVQPPQPYVYQMPPAGTMPVMEYPVIQTMPIPQIVQKPVMIAPQAPVMIATQAPVAQPDFSGMDKDELVKILIQQLAK